MATQASPEARFHGGGEYAKFIFFSAIDNGFTNFVGIYNPSLELDPLIHKTCKEKNISLIMANGLEEMMEIINNGNYSRFYSALPYGLNKINTSKIKFMMTIHGLREMECYYDSILWSYTKRIKDKAKGVIKFFIFRKLYEQKAAKAFEPLFRYDNATILTVSKHSKYSILSLFPFVHEERIKVFRAPCPFGPELPACHDHFLSDLSSVKFFLMVSGNRWQKNVLRAIRAFDNFFDKNPNSEYKVIITGLDEPLEKTRNSDKFIFIDYVEHETLHWLYKHSFCFVYPSLNEGYGYPPLQAMRYGTPVLASCAASIPEVCKDNVLYFDPRNETEIENRITQITLDKDIYQSLLKKGEAYYNEVKEKQTNDVQTLLSLIFQGGF
ncbi:glycosyltransferase [Pluralibacter gergoviae]